MTNSKEKMLYFNTFKIFPWFIGFLLGYYQSILKWELIWKHSFWGYLFFCLATSPHRCDEGTITKNPTFVLPRIGIYIGIYYWKCHTVKEDRKKWFLCRVCVCSTSHACVKYGTELRITYLYILIQGRLFHYIRHRGLILGPYKVNICIPCHRRGVRSYGKLPSR